MAGDNPKWRESFLYEYFKENWLPGIPTMVAVRTSRWKYVRYPEINDTDELYDLARDPHELHNLANDPAAGRVRRPGAGRKKRSRPTPRSSRI